MLRSLLLGCLAALPLLGAGTLSAQELTRHVQHQPYLDLRRYYLGLRIGLHSRDLQLRPSGLSDHEERVLIPQSPDYQPGFSIGVIGGLTLSPGLELRLVPTLHLGSVSVSYTDGLREQLRTEARSSSLQLPLELKWGLRRGNIRPFLLTGLYTDIELGGRQSDLLRLRPLSYGWSSGVGCDLYFSRFKLSPQLSLHYGLGDTLLRDRPELEGARRRYYTEAIAHARARMLLFSLSIE